ncbi:tyrosine-type recombinase/integrase [Actinokineospora inagensis]|uniref:tyrosine-type recombinase/integrase n=1 Tax=Actinokineospora inagensis TaxID=103730 RepID=UPI00041B06EE|nr:tyrosine-type recombinase/integrase [Actinokineospora inagensis]
MPVLPDESRQRGRIEQRGSNLRVVVYAGDDPVTGKRSYLRESVKGNDKAAYKRANTVLTRLLAQVEKQRVTETSISLGEVLEEWLKVAEMEDSTRAGYRGYIERNIRPALGALAARKITPRVLESFNAELRRCRDRCDGKPFVAHKSTGLHDCLSVGCKPHMCKPLAASTVRQIHAVISGALAAAVRWEWLDDNPARKAQRPRQSPSQPNPPSAAEAALLIEAAFEVDDDWGTLVWLVMTTGMRRGEVCALRWDHIDLDLGVLEIRQSYIDRGGIKKIKDTKTHQMRRIALDTETAVLLRELRQRCGQRCAALNIEFTGDLYVFVGARNPDPRVPCKPDSVSGRYKYMATKLGIETHIHELRHYSATELLTAGVDLRTVAGRLGHGGGGATTLRVYAAWVAGADRKAAEILASRMPKRRSKP